MATQEQRNAFLGLQAEFNTGAATPNDVEGFRRRYTPLFNALSQVDRDAVAQKRQGEHWDPTEANLNNGRGGQRGADADRANQDRRRTNLRGFLIAALELPVE